MKISKSALKFSSFLFLAMAGPILLTTAFVVLQQLIGLPDFEGFARIATHTGMTAFFAGLGLIGVIGLRLPMWVTLAVTPIYLALYTTLLSTWTFLVSCLAGAACP